jgi:hypothetical protein
MTEHWDQPGPAHPIAARSVSEMGDKEFSRLLSAREKAGTATPVLQRLLLLLPALAMAVVIAGLVLFITSHFRMMDVRNTIGSAGNHVGDKGDVDALSGAVIVGLGAIAAFAGARFDVAARTRAILMTFGSVLMIVPGSAAALLLDPSRADLLRHYHVGTWGSRASFFDLVHALDALCWAVAACGVVIVVIMMLQRRRVSAAYPT